MKKWIVLILLGGFLLPSISQGIDLKQSKFTQVVNNVEVISAADKARHSAAVNDVFKMPDVLRTGPDSRAELVAPDNTITRVGANTIFSFDPANRTIDLQQGSILFHSPHGKGGGTIRTGSATASVIGTTIIVTSTPGGGFKLLDLEGQAEIRFLNGLHRTLEPGQMTFILPGGGASPIVVFRLDSQTKGSQLVNGFGTPLPSIGKIEAEITRQLLQILNNQAQDTGLLVGNNATPDSVQVRMDILGLGSSQHPSGFQSDASVVGNDHVSGLPVNYSPLDPNHVVNNSFTPPDMDSINQGLLFLGITAPASGFTGSSIDIDTANVDLSSFAGKSDFDFVASGDIKIWQSVDFTPAIDEPLEVSPIIIAPDTISLIAGGQMLIASGSTLEADTGTFGLVADSFGTLDTESGTVGEANTLDDVRIINHVGDVDILSLQDLNVLGSSICAGGGVDIESQNGSLNIGEGDLPLGDDEDGTLINARNGDLTITAGGSISISDGDLEAHSSDSVSGDDEPSLGNVTISGTGSVEIENNTYIYGDGNVDISSSGTISLDTEGSSSGSIDIEDSQIEAGGCVGVTADGTVYISDDDITADSGRITISGGSDVSIFSSTIDANGSVNITSGGTLVIGNEDSVTALDDGYDVSISAGGSVRLSANGGGDVDVTDTSISADCNVCITTCGTISLSGDDTEEVGGNIDLEDSSVTAGSSINVNANDGNVTINGTTLTAGSDYQDIETLGAPSEAVNIASSGGDITVSADDTASISDSTLDVKGNVSIFGDSSISSEEADVTISGGSGSVSISGNDVSLDDTEILGNKICISDTDISATDGNVNITDGGSISISGRTVSVDDDSDISANNITIKSGSDISASTGDVNITDNGSLTISADCSAEISGSTIDVNNIKICDSTITADDGNITIDNEGMACMPSSDDSDTITVNTISINGSEIAASGNVTIISANGDVTINDSPISATVGNEATGDEISSDKVSISSGGELSITGTDSAGTSENEFGYDIGADSKVCLSGANGVSINDAVITTLNGDLSDMVKISSSSGDIGIDSSDITSGGNICINSDGSILINQLDTVDTTTITAGGDIDLHACDDVTTYETTISANGGDVNICAGGDVDLEYTDVSADGSVNVNADGSVTVYNGNLCLNDWNINAGSYVDLGADGFTDVKNSDIIASGDIDIESGSGSIDLGCSTFSSGDISSGSIEDCSVTISSDGSSITVGNSDNNGITINHSTFTSGGVTISSGSVITADNGDVNITGNGGDITIGQGDNNDITVNCSTFISGGVSISDSQITANNGDVIITGNGGAISIGDGDDNTVSENDDTFETGNIDISGSTIVANNGNVNISGSGDVTICDSPITATAGVEPVGESESSDDKVIISSGGELSITGTDSAGTSDNDFGYDIGADRKICLSGDNGVSINDALIETLDGSSCDEVKISSDGTICVDGSEIDSSGKVKMTAYDGGSVNVVDGSSISASGDVCITSDGTVSLSADDTVVEGGSIDIECSSVSADGSVFISASGNVTINDSQIDFGKCNDLTISDNQASQNGDIYAVSQNGDVDISAGGGQVVICSGGDISLQDSQFHPEGNLSISDSSINTISGNISITTGGEIDIYGDDSLSMSGVEVVGGSISISDSTIHAITSGDINIGGDGQIFFNGSLQYCGYTAVAGDISISDSDITADDGDVNINSGGIVTIQGDAGDWIISGNNVNVTADCDVDLDAAYIAANAGDLNITAGGVLNIADNCLNGNTSLSGDAVTLTGGEGVSLDWNFGSATITANNGNVLIESQNGDVLIGGVSITANDGVVTSAVTPVGDVDIYADFGNVDLEGATVTATAGNVDIEAGHSDSGGSETLTLNNDIINAGSSVTLSAPGNGNLNQDAGGITISGTSINANTASGMICVNNASGVTTIDNGSSMQAFYIKVNSPDGIMFDGAGGSISANTMCLKASLGDASDDATGGHSVTVQNTDLSDLTVLNIQAHTVDFNGDNFDSAKKYTVSVFYGGFHINDGNVGGYANFNGCTLDNNPITSSDPAGTVNPNNNGGITTSSGSGPGIYIK